MINLKTYREMNNLLTHLGMIVFLSAAVTTFFKAAASLFKDNV